MADLLEEQQDKSSLVAKLLAYRAKNNMPKDTPKDKTNPKTNSNKDKPKEPS